MSVGSCSWSTCRVQRVRCRRSVSESDLVRWPVRSARLSFTGHPGQPGEIGINWPRERPWLTTNI
eukprot:161398-Prymnesium_polylepis.2